MIKCGFRVAVEDSELGETAHCRLLEALRGEDTTRREAADATANDPLAFRVPRAACEVCEHRRTSRLLGGRPVFASLVLNALSDRPGELVDAATAVLNGTHPARPSFAVHCCDVLLDVAGLSDAATTQRIEDVVRQQRLRPTIWLVNSDGDPSALRRDHPAIELLAIDGPLQAAASSIASGRGRSSFVAIWPTTQPAAAAVAEGLDRLLEDGAAAAPLWAESDAVQRADVSARSLRETGLLVCRSVLVDLEGHAFATDEEWHEAIVAWDGHVISEPPRPTANRLHGETVDRCDVVLPFHGQVAYVRQAVRSVLTQRGCEPVLHLIDDASPDTAAVDRLFGELAGQSNVRLYRNDRNVGQFHSFNATAAFWETAFVAVQDADDVSRPDRLRWSLAMLQATQADLFGGAVELFGDREALVAGATDGDLGTRETLPRYRVSRFPRLMRPAYFLENPTLVVRASAFRQLGGFADFGDRLRNRGSLDSEFQVRAALCGARIAVSRRVVLDYRIHPASATQDTSSGWGTRARAESQQLSRAFRQQQLLGPFDPRAFGALGRQDVVTRRWRSIGDVPSTFEESCETD